VKKGKVNYPRATKPANDHAEEPTCEGRKLHDSWLGPSKGENAKQSVSFSCAEYVFVAGCSVQVDQTTFLSLHSFPTRGLVDRLM
jgi:hypothetical protein